MKKYCTILIERQNISKTDLIKTKWFKNKIKIHLANMWISID